MPATACGRAGHAAPCDRPRVACRPAGARSRAALGRIVSPV